MRVGHFVDTRLPVSSGFFVSTLFKRRSSVGHPGRQARFGVVRVVAQWIEYRVSNPRVVGSSPTHPVGPYRPLGLEPPAAPSGSSFVCALCRVCVPHIFFAPYKTLSPLQNNSGGSKKYWRAQ